MEEFWGENPLHGEIALCKISEVNSDTRTCTIKTYGSSRVAANGDFSSVQWLSVYTSLEGAEISFVPENGTQGVCVFEGSQPYIIGFFSPVSIDSGQEIPDTELEGNDPAGASAGLNKEKINEGDYIFRTSGKCRVVLRKGGEVELEATKLCKRTYFPTRNLINELCQNYEFRTDGGSIDWIHPDPASEKTLFVQEWRDDVSRTNLIIDQKGSVEAGSALIHRFQIGPTPDNNKVDPPPFKPVFIRETLNTGSTFLRINEFALTEQILETGELIYGIGGYNFYQNIKPTGEALININNNYEQVILPTGEMTLKVGIKESKEENIIPSGGDPKFLLNIKPSGDTSIDIAKKVSVTLKADGNVTVDSGGGKSVINIDPSGAVTIKTATEVVIDTEEVNLKASSVKLGKSVSDSVPLGKLLLASINKLVDAFNSHSHSVPQSPAGVNPSSPPLLPAMNIGEDVLSTSVEVQS